LRYVPFYRSLGRRGGEGGGPVPFWNGMDLMPLSTRRIVGNGTLKPKNGRYDALLGRWGTTPENILGGCQQAVRVRRMAASGGYTERNRWRQEKLRTGEDAIGIEDAGVGGEQFAPAETGAEILLGEFPEGIAAFHGDYNSLR